MIKRRLNIYHAAVYFNVIFIDFNNPIGLVGKLWEIINYSLFGLVKQFLDNLR